MHVRGGPRTASLGLAPGARGCPRAFRVAFASLAPGRKTLHRAAALACRATSSSEQIQLLQPNAEGITRTNEARPLLIYFPGTDGTGNAIAPQLPGLLGAGYDVRSLYIDISDRSDWEELTAQAVRLIRELLEVYPTESQVTLLAESFGGCLALRCAAFAPELFERMILVNPATAFASSYGGLLNLVASSNLLSVFPEQLYQIAQAVLLPFLVDKNNVGNIGLDAVRQMIIMQPPDNRRIAELASSQGATAQSRRSLLEQFESYGPAAAGSWRLSLLCTGNLSDEILSSIRTQTLLISSAKDRLLGSLQEGARLERVMQNAMRVVLPKSGHTALLEEDVKLINILRWTNFLPPDLQASAAQSTGPSSAGWQAVGFNSEAHRGGMAAEAAAEKRHGSLHLHSRPPARLARSKGAISGRQLVVANAATSTEIASPMSAVESAVPTNGVAEAGSTGEFRSSTVTFRRASVLPVERSQPQLPESISTGNGAGEAARAKSKRFKAFQQEKEVAWSQPEKAFDQLTAVYSPFREIISPVVQGLENLPSAADTKRPLLLVGNHARVGLYDLPFLVIELYMRRIKVRGLAHPGHWKGPLGTIFESFGAVKASPMAAYKLLKAGEAVLLFPGGGREVNKRKGEEYQLFWSEEPDFVRLAAKLNALVIPFASVGGDEAFDLLLDSEEVLRTPVLGDLMRAAFARAAPELDLAESVPPVTRLPGTLIPSPVPVPNFSRLYFRFMPPIDPAASEGILDKPQVTQRVYKEVKDQVCTGIELLQEERRRDSKSGLPARLIDQFMRALPAFDVLR